jgi:hypothetical protein
MTEKESISYKKELLDLLANTTGHFEATSVEDKQSIKSLRENLVTVLANENISTIKNSFYSTDNSDLFFTDAIETKQMTQIKNLVTRFEKQPKLAEQRVFAREVPLQNVQIKGSVATWADGAAIQRTVGPFLSKDGRRIWFDFYKIERLTSLYISGEANPALLFDAFSKRKPARGSRPYVIRSKKTYILRPDTIWVASKILAPNAPSGLYTGLKIKSGKITLDTKPTITDGKIKVSSNTKVAVSLNLDQPAVANADPTSPYGLDARNVLLALPKTLSLHFSGNGSKIDDTNGDIDSTIYGQQATFKWNNTAVPTYNATLKRILIAYNCSENSFTVEQCLSPFNTVAGTAEIAWSAWTLPATQIDITKPSPAAGIGGIAIQTKKGLTTKWQVLNGGDVNLTNPLIQYENGVLCLTDQQAGNLYCNQEYKLWKDDQNPHGSTIKIQYTNNFPILYLTTANGIEALKATANANPLLDRPVTVAGNTLDIHSKNSTLLIAISKTLRLIYLYDDNILFDNLDPNKPTQSIPPPIALALQNALFKTTTVNGLLLFGELNPDMIKIKKGSLFLTFGMYAYLPTLPDPYAANLNKLKNQFRTPVSVTTAYVAPQPTIWLWLISQISWSGTPSGKDLVTVSFHFAPIQNQFQALLQTPTPNPTQLSTQPAETQQASIAEDPPSENTAETPVSTMTLEAEQGLTDYQKIWDSNFSALQDEAFALLDVSSNANQLGVSFGQFGRERMLMVQTHTVAEAPTNTSVSQFPLKIDGLDVTTQGFRARSFMLPQVSWEPLHNLAIPQPPKPGDPTHPIIYYPDDGGPTRIMNNSVQFVPLSPIPLSKFLKDKYAEEPNNVTFAYFTLPFGLRSLAYLYKFNKEQQGQGKKIPNMQFNSPNFENNLTGGIQFQLDAGSGLNDQESDSFRGYTLQMNNILDLNGQKTGASTLGYDVCFIFNNDFFDPSKPLDYKKGVPVTRIDLSGYGESTFSEWLNKGAQFAQTSQAKFNVFVGRTAYEVIQVKSILYPWGIKVVRTITIFRVGSAYVYRHDSGWRAESDGKFDFRFKYTNNNGNQADASNPYNIHPGVIKGLFNIRNIRNATDDVLPFLTTMNIKGFYDLNLSDQVVQFPQQDKYKDVNLQPVYFDADIEIENVIQGQIAGRVPSKKILGFVQLAPKGIPLTPKALEALLDRQLGSIGGPVDCVTDIGKSAQKLRLNWFDVNISHDDAGSPLFVAAARGSAVLPKDGSWSIVMHNQGTGEVTPLPETLTIPLIRVGKLIDDIASIPDTGLLRIANPTELLRTPNIETVNFGFLQSTNTQKILFLTPAFEKAQLYLMSKTPPLFADAYRLLSSKGIFPNIGDAITNFGDSIALAKNAFLQGNLQDGATTVLKLMGINTTDGITRKIEDGYKFWKQIENFDLPSGEWYLINEDYLKVYVKYARAPPKTNGQQPDINGLLNFDVNSYANNIKDRWKSRLNNLSMIVDLGPFKQLLTIKGNFDAKKGEEAGYIGTEGDPDFPAPQLEFSKDLEPVIEILQILQQLQGGNYAEALKKGLKIAMSNSSDSWEYKFEASKEIPVVKFPVPDAVYNDPTTPLKLEASMKVGVYFNSALSVAALTDPKKLLPTAGAYMDFYGRLSVMCVSLAAATVYATGQVNLKIAADTQVGPSLAMKFGFGAQVVAGLPVVGNVSLLYMVGTEIYADSTKLNISAFMLFSGHAELLGGLVGVTISIEARGTISRDSNKTILAAQVTFAIDISIFLVIDISFSESWEEDRQIA